MGIYLPGLDGMQTTSRIRTGSPDAAVVILTPEQAREHMLSGTASMEILPR